MRSVLDRAGHLSELALDRLRFDPTVAPDEKAEADAHLATCAACRDAMAMLASEDASFAVAPRVRVSALRPRISTGWIGAGVSALALAAVVLLAVRVRPRDDGDVMRLRGSPIDFEVFVHDGSDSRAVLSGDTVHPGERVGFRVRARDPGYLLVLGHDDTGNRYLCYPEGVIGDAIAVAFQESPEPRVLPTAMRFDDILGSEHITAIFCPAPFTAYDVGPDMQPAGCISHEVSLVKQQRGP